jgi:hypothetical protein
MISLVYPYFETPEMLAFQLAHWSAFPLDLRKQLEFIIIDDGSPDRPADIPSVNLNLKLYRVNENVKWNHPGAQNLGAHVASCDWLWSGAIDNVITEKSMYGILGLDTSDPHTFYKFHDYNTGNPEQPGMHYAVNYLSRWLYWHIGGYDEDFTGYWGADDVCFEKMLVKQGGNRVVVPEDVARMEVYDEGTVVGANTHAITDGWGWARGMNPRNKQMWRSKMKGKSSYGKNPLRFTWQKEIEYSV